jgi:LAO/AO transport system kinase
MVDFFVIKIAGAGDELQGIKRVLWKWQIQLSSIKQMAITFERHSQNQSSTERYIYFQKKSGWIPTTATCSAITQDGFQSLGNHHEIYRTHEKQ